MNTQTNNAPSVEPPPGMVEKRGQSLWLTHALMIFGVLIIFFPIWLAFVASTVTQSEIVSPPMPLLPGEHFFDNYKRALFSGVNVPVATMLFNSLVMAIGIAVGKIIISLLSAFAIVYFRFPGRTTFFWLIFITLMLPVEVRIVPTYEVVAGFGDSIIGANGRSTWLVRRFGCCGIWKCGEEPCIGLQTIVFLRVFGSLHCSSQG